MLLAHKLVCKFAFLESDTGGKFLSVTNRYSQLHFKQVALPAFNLLAIFYIKKSGAQVTQMTLYTPLCVQVISGGIRGNPLDGMRFSLISRKSCSQY